MKRHVFGVGIVAGLALAAAAFAQTPPALQWEGMQKTSFRAFDEGWRAPGVDFRSYSKVMIDPAEASFRKDWQRDYNKVHFDIERRITDEDAQKILAEAQAGLSDAFARAAREAGFQVVTTPGPDVLRLKPYVIDLEVRAPDLKTSTRDDTFAEEAGSGRLVIEFRDSSSGALLAGGVDKRDIGDLTFLSRRSSVSNRADFSRAFRRWGNLSFDALGSLGATPSRTAGG
ncbi:MAG TPA: DUF3313 family protein [Hyphomonadaceae bacterium]|nr:DUF3313 family protein [Hyphomonadaceae bacterium]